MHKISKGLFCGGRNTLELVTYKDKIFIQQLLQKYVVICYYVYLLPPGIDRTEAVIPQHFYWPGIRKSSQMEVASCDTCQRTESSITKYSKLHVKLAEEIPWNKLCVVIIFPYKYTGKGKNL